VEGFVKVLWATKKGLVSNESGNHTYELIKDPWKITSIHSRGHNIGIDKSIKIESDNKLKKFYLKGIVYHEDFVLSPILSDSWWATEQELHLWREKKQEEFSSSDLQNCDGHTVS